MNGPVFFERLLMANNNAIYNAVLAGITGAGQQRWITSQTASSYISYTVKVIAIASAIDALIPTDSGIGIAQARLMQSICEGIYADRDPSGTGTADIARAIVALYTAQTVNLTPESSGGSGLTSFNGRTTPAAIPTAGDYLASQVSNDSTVVGATTALALNTLNTAVGARLTSFNGRTTPAAVPTAGDYAASLVTNDSSVSGANVALAFNTLNTAVGARLTSFNGRTTPAAVPTAGDYAATQITNDSSVSGANVALAFNTLNTAVGARLTSFNGRTTPAAVPTAGDYAATQITNDSSVSGANVALALNNLASSIVTISGTAPISVTLGVVAIADPSNTSKGAVPTITTANGALLANGAGTSSSWALITGPNVSTSAALTITSVSCSSFVGVGAANQATTGNFRLSHGVSEYGRNNANSANVLLWDWGATTADTLTMSAFIATSGSFTSFVGIGAANRPTTGNIRLSHGSTFVGRNFTNTADVAILDWGASLVDKLVFQSNVTFGSSNVVSFLNGFNVGLGSAVVTTNISFGASNYATAGNLRFSSSVRMVGRNTANSADVSLIDWGTTTADILTLGGVTQRIRIDATTGLAFYSATPIAQQTAVGALTDSTTGTPSTTLNDVGVVFSQSAINNNFASVLTKLNAINTRLSQAAGGIGLTA